MTTENNVGRLAIGTAQFGLPYGVANKTGQVVASEVSAILAAAKAAGINTIDTAIAYGGSEQVLGKTGIAGWQVISKLPPVPADCADVTAWVHQSVELSLERLQVTKLHGLLLHRGQDLLSTQGSALCRAVEEIKKEGKIGAFGVSVYDPAEFNDYFGKFDIGLIQCPLNIFDRRLVSGGWLEKLSASGIELHVRSAFLQGLLLMPVTDIPVKFQRWQDLLNHWHVWLKTNGTNPLTACLQFVKSFSQISKVVVGIDSLLQLKEIIAAWRTEINDLPEDLRSDDIQLINPSLWSRL